MEKERSEMKILNNKYITFIFSISIIVIVIIVIIHFIAGHKNPITDKLVTSAQYGSTGHKSQPPKNSGNLQSHGTFRVRRVLDGDTVILNNGETVRLIGIDAPEIHHPELPVQRFGEEARDFLKKMIEGFECRIEIESENQRDKYDRLLAYVYMGNLMANKEMIRRGYAYVYTRFPFYYQAEFMLLEQEARNNHFGLWDYSLQNGRIANVISKYESLNLEGRKKFDELLEKLLKEYPIEKQKYATAPPDTSSSIKNKQSTAPILVISWQDAAHYYGKHATVEGTIVGSYNSGKACFLNFHSDYKNHFTSVIFASTFNRFPPKPEKYYLHKKVRITGIIKEYQGRPEIILETPVQVQVIQ